MGRQTGCGLDAMNDTRSLRDVLFANPKIAPERKAIMFEGRWRTFGDLQARVGMVGAALRRAGVGPGDRVAVLLHNRPEFIESYFAVTGLGAILVPLNWRLHAAEHAALLVDAEPGLLIAGRAYEPSFERLLRNVPSLRRIVAVDEAGGAPDSYEAWIRPGGKMPQDAQLGRDTEAAILYTSGTTSRPKGVVLTHGNYIADFANVASVVRPDQNGLNLQVSPLYHAACVHSFFHLAYGAATVLIEKFEPGEALRLIERERVTYFFAAPTALYQMMDHPNFAKGDRSSLRAISYGAAGISKARLEEAAKAFGPILLHAYGMTETTSHASLLRSDDHGIALGSIGKGLGQSEIRVVDEHGVDRRPGEIGEIIIRGPNLMKGYWRRPEATVEAIRGGWLHSGDLARIDENGFVYVVDRLKDMVISGGVNIYPREIEDVISAHPAVAEVAVYGMPDERWGEALAAAVVPRSDMSVDPQEIVDFCRGRIGGYKVPKRVRIVDVLPKNASGKVLKTELRKVG
jgi:acyl-CoA synthetase (AMP-forming)/AMP-acid ligase II